MKKLELDIYIIYIYRDEMKIQRQEKYRLFRLIHSSSHYYMI